MHTGNSDPAAPHLPDPISVLILQTMHPEKLEYVSGGDFEKGSGRGRGTCSETAPEAPGPQQGPARMLSAAHTPASLRETPFLSGPEFRCVVQAQMAAGKALTLTSERGIARCETGRRNYGRT